MKLEMTVSEVTELFKEIQKQPDQLFEMIRTDIYSGPHIPDNSLR